MQRLTETRDLAVDHAATELRRIERDLHDGAQARLIALGMNLRAVERMLPGRPEAALALVAEARETSLRALSDLRDLVRGICPPVLADRGLGHAVRALALDTPFPVDLDIDLPGRLTTPVESACYFAVAEALANAVRHSGARRVHIRMQHTAGLLRVQVADDGAGGADPARGIRAAGRGAAAGRVRWHPGGQQPAGRADHDRHGGAVRVVVAEDLFLLRDGLTRLLGAHGFEIAAAVDSAPDLLCALLDQRPDVAVVDVRLPPSFADDGLQAALAARQQVPGLPVLLLSQYVEQLYARELLADQSGAVGYLLKDRVFNDDQFVDAIRTVASGGTVMDPEVVSKLLGRRARDEPITRLSAREREVLALMAEGRSNVAIAQRLFVTEKAVSKHTTSIFTKLGLAASEDDNRRVLAVLAYLERLTTRLGQGLDYLARSRRVLRPVRRLPGPLAEVRPGSCCRACPARTRRGRPVASAAAATSSCSGLARCGPILTRIRCPWTVTSDLLPGQRTALHGVAPRAEAARLG